MKKLLLSIVVFCTFTIAVAKTDTTNNAVDTRPNFELHKADSGSINTLTDYQICVINCLNTYYPWQERALERCLSNCGVQ